MKTTLLHSSVLAASLALSACNPGKFDDLKDEMWVDSSTAPDGLDSSDYGYGIAWGGNSDTGIKFYVVGNRPALAQVAYTETGEFSKSALRVNAFLGSADVLSSARPAIAGDPDSVGGSVGTVAFGVAQEGAATIVLLNPDTFAFTGQISLENVTELVDSIAMGPTNAGGSGSDIVAVRSRAADSRLTLVPEYQTADLDMKGAQQSCLLARQIGFSVTVGDLDSASPDSEILVALGERSRQGAASEVHILAGSLVEAAQGMGADTDCFAAGAALATIAPPGGEADFGAAMVIGDFNGDGVRDDVAISAPSENKVYVYFAVDTSVGAPGAPLEITPPPGVESYGDSLAAGDFDGDGRDELVIGDPRADVDAVVNSGRVDIVMFDANEQVSNTYSVYDAEAENSQLFGRAVHVARYKGEDLLIVGAKDEVFAYFRTPVPGDIDDRK